MSSVRVRFAPSPTGNVHIGNIRAAIFNYLFARHEKGEFLLRVEDTDLERSTPEAIAALMDVLDWLALLPDEEPLFQSTRREAHLAAAEDLIEKGFAYRHARSADESPAVFFRIPENLPPLSSDVRNVGEVDVDLHADVPVVVDFTGMSFASVSKKGKAVETQSCLAGLHQLKVLDAEGAVLFALADNLEAVLSGGLRFESTDGAKIRFVRRELVFTDLVKGELSKPLDSMKDLVIVRGDGSPVFHLANVCDDAFQSVTHIVRGDDHVENTYRHIPLFRALGLDVPTYAHLPMIVNQQGKPYSKRDGDAYVGDFRDKGFLPESLFNYLALLGWNPGDEREVMNRDELISAFTLDRVQRSPAQMDLRKLAHINGQNLQKLPRDVFLADVRDILARRNWAAGADIEFVAQVADLMRPRTQTYADIDSWAYFFADPDIDEKALKRGLGKAWQRDGLNALATQLESTDDPAVALRAAEAAMELDEGKLNLTTRVVTTGVAGGADLLDTLALLGKETVQRRVQRQMQED